MTLIKTGRKPEKMAAEWSPRTKLGRLVLEGKIISLEEVFNSGYRIQEPEIVDSLLPNLKQEVLSMGIVQKQTDAGEKSRFRVVVAVGNENGFIGVGTGKAKQIRLAVDKAAMQAKLNITPVRRGCGSWECGCGKPHSTSFQVEGKCGSVRFQIIPAPRGVGLVANETAKIILRLAGIKDCWTRSFGSTSTATSIAFSVYDALKKTYKIVTPQDWTR